MVRQTCPLNLLHYFMPDPLALDLGAGNWKLAFTVGLGQKPRLKTITARSTLSLVLEIKAAKRRFGLPEDAPVLCCYAGG